MRKFTAAISGSELTFDFSCHAQEILLCIPLKIYIARI